MDAASIDSPLVLLDQQMVEAQVYGFLHGCVGVFSTRCPGKETANEDGLAIVPFDDHSGALVVADGMGGHAAGELAARAAVQAVVAEINEARAAGSLLRAGIIDGFERANREVQALGAGAGTTLAVVEIGGEGARPYHAGDSAVLVVGLHGRVKIETTAHSPVGFGVEAGLLDEAEAMEHEDRHLVLNAVGCDTMRIEVGSAMKLAKRDTVLLASDGLTDNLVTHEVVDRIRKGQLFASLNQLVSDCQVRMTNSQGPAKPDDLTVVVYRPSN